MIKRIQANTLRVPTPSRALGDTGSKWPFQIHTSGQPEFLKSKSKKRNFPQSTTFNKKVTSHRHQVSRRLKTITRGLIWMNSQFHTLKRGDQEQPSKSRLHVLQRRGHQTLSRRLRNSSRGTKWTKSRNYGIKLCSEKSLTEWPTKKVRSDRHLTKT